MWAPHPIYWGPGALHPERLRLLKPEPITCRHFVHSSTGGHAFSGRRVRTGRAAREGQGGQVSWTHAPVTRRRASWAGVIGFWQRAQGSLAERAVLASKPSGGSPTGPRPIGPESVTGRPTPPGQKMTQVGLCYPLADRHPASALTHPYTVAPAQRDWGKRRRRSGS